MAKKMFSGVVMNVIMVYRNSKPEVAMLSLVLSFALSLLGGWFGGQLLPRFPKGERSHPHHKVEHISARVAAKAVEEAALGVDGKGRSFFRVERTEPAVPPTRSPQGDMRRHDVQDAYPAPDLIGDFPHP